MLMNCTVIAVAIIVNNHIICKQNQFHLLDFYRSTLNCKNHILQYIHILHKYFFKNPTEKRRMIFLFLHISFAFKVPRYLLVQKYEERLELARKSTRKWQRTLKINRLCGLSWIKNDQVLIFLLKIFGVFSKYLYLCT